MERNKHVKQNSINFTGLCTLFHNQYFEMINILIHYYKRAMGGLNTYTLPYVLQYQVDMNEMDRKMKEYNTKSLLSKDCQGDNLATIKIGKIKPSKQEQKNTRIKNK